MLFSSLLFITLDLYKYVINLCLSLGFIAVKRHHDQGNSYKGKHLTGAGLQFQRFSPLSSWWETWWHTCRHDAKDSWTFYISIQRQPGGASLPPWMELEHRTSKPTPTVTHFLQQSHTHSNTATAPNGATYHKSSILKPLSQAY